MKIWLMICVFSFNFAFSQESKDKKCNTQPFRVYLDDQDKDFNVRAQPNGKIILKINNEHSDGFIMNVIDFENGWLKIDQINGIDELTITEFEGWIHNSIIGITATHNISLLDQPDGKKVLDITGETGETFKIINIACEWVEIKTQKGTGWVKSEQLCGNPVTTCP